jgi:hypothetical protein
MRALSFMLLLIIIFSYSCRKISENQLSTLVKFEQKNFEEALSLASQQNKRIMVDFWSYG